MKATENKTLWARLGNIKEISVMCKSVILFGSGCFLEFLNLNSGESRRLTLNSTKGNGDGLKCYSGHVFFYVFAYCENSLHPFIYVKSYPDFHIIAKFQGAMEGIKSLLFSDSSLLFALGEMPHYTLTVWNWRTRETFAEGANELLFENQMLRVSWDLPTFLAQLGVNSNKLFIWDVFTVCKTSILSKHEVMMGKLKPAPFQTMVWSSDKPTSLYVIDHRGCVYMIDRDFHLELVIDISSAQICGHITPSICWFEHGLMISGPNQEIRHYKKVGSAWICDSSFLTEKPIYNIVSGQNEKCIGRTDISDIVMFSTTQESITYARKNQSDFQSICALNPAVEFMVVLRSGFYLDAYKITTGEILSTITLDHKILSIDTSPLYPYVGTGHEDGTISLVSFFDAAKPQISIQLSLANFSLNNFRFFEHGQFFVTGCKNSGEFFVLKGIPGTQIQVVVHIQVDRQVTDYMAVGSRNMIKFFVIPVTQKIFYGGNEVWRYCVVDGQVVNIKKFSFINSDTLYTSLIPKKGPERDRSFYLIPFRSRRIEAVETKRGDPFVYITDTIKSGHQIKKFLVKPTARHMVTWGYDGFIFIRSLDFKELKSMALSHHRERQGVRNAFTTPFAHMIVSLGYDGILTAVYCAVNVKDQILQEIKEQMDSPKFRLMFKRPTLGFEVEKRFVGKCWIEIQRLKKIEMEQVQCSIERNKLLKEFQDIKSNLQHLVSENYLVPENKKLDMLEFYLDAVSYREKQQKNKIDCKKLETYLRCLIIAQDTVSDYMINNYYKAMGVQWENIMGIFSVVKATNYCLLPPNIDREKRIQWIEEQRKVEQYLNIQDTFEPWESMSKLEVNALAVRRPVAPKDDYTGTISLFSIKDDAELLRDPEEYLETKIALAGKVSELYIDCSPAHYRQRQLTTFYQSELEQAVVETETIKLKQNYNTCFANTRAIKEREMYTIRERNARLRHIISEYNYFSEKKIKIEIVDPEWHPIEKVESKILRVEEEEVPVRPYVSPSEQQMLDAKAAEEERLRLLQLADALFRESALMAMMNAVLEIRWEDELKKNVPIPKCMTEKIPEEYNEEDLRAIRDYEEKVVQLKTEREKYKSLLEAEFNKLSVTVRDSIRKFNQKLRECTKFKFYIDSGMNQENLIVNRQRVIQNRRIELYEKDNEIIKIIRENEAVVKFNHKVISIIQEALVKGRANLETMQTKEKQLEKLFKKDFQDMSRVVQEQAYKLYKKRPKYSFRKPPTATVLIVLAKSVSTNEITLALTQECLNYMNALNQLDEFSDLPPTINERIWNLICKHRRLRIEHEMRLGATEKQLVEGEAGIETFQNRIATKKEKIIMLHAELKQTRQTRLDLIHNKQLQFVLRRGLVEVPLSGDLYADFKDAILIPRAEIERVNRLIMNAGNKKIKSIEKNMKFRRTMMAYEWQHTKLRMVVNDLIEEIKDIESVKLTKEMQTYIKNKSMGRRTQVESYEFEKDIIEAAFRNRIKDKKDKVRKLNRHQQSYRKNNQYLDKVIKEVNIDLCQYRIDKDYKIEEDEKEIVHAMMRDMIRRNKLVQQIQANHNEILVLETELELLRLRTFPTFKYKILDE